MSRLSWPPDVVRERAGIIPVPLAPSRRRDRGFNQSEILAAHLSQIWDVPMLSTALGRGRGTQSQTQLTPGERLGNVAGAFVVPHSARKEVIGRHLILLDDVVTTGSTLGACAKALFAAGARTVVIDLLFPLASVLLPPLLARSQKSRMWRGMSGPHWPQPP